MWLEYTRQEETRYKREIQKTDKSEFDMPAEYNIDFILNAMEDSPSGHNRIAWLRPTPSLTEDKYKSRRSYLKKMFEGSENSKDR